MVRRSQKVTAPRNTKKVGSLESRHWFFTFNNYTVEDIKELEAYFDSKGDYLFQEEIGEKGTKHLQGQVSFKSVRDTGFQAKLSNKIHWEITKNKNAAINYCKKAVTRNGTLYTNMDFDVIEDPLEGKTLYSWQQNIIDIINSKPDDRSIHWIVDRNGNSGKSALCKHIVLKHKRTIAVSGKASDIKYAVASCKLKPKTIMWDVPRTSMEYISYEAIETIKNGLFFVNKYESQQIVMNPPHIIIFANEEPVYSLLTKDRWKVIHL